MTLNFRLLFFFLPLIIVQCKSQDDIEYTKISFDVNKEDTLLFPYIVILGAKLKNPQNREIVLPVNFKATDSCELVFQAGLIHTIKFPMAFWGNLNGKYGVIIDVNNDNHFSKEHFYEIPSEKEAPFVRVNNIPFLSNGRFENRTYLIQPFVSTLFGKPRNMFKYVPKYKQGMLCLDSTTYKCALINFVDDTIYNKKGVSLIVYEKNTAINNLNEVKYKMGDTIYFKNTICKFEDVLGNGDSIVLKKIGAQNKNYGPQEGQYVFADSVHEIKKNNPICLMDKGRYTLLDFWGTWCGPCLAVIDKVHEIGTVYADKLRVVGICYDDNRDNVLKVMKEMKIVFPTIFDARKSSVLTKKYNVSAFPTFILVDKKGLIIRRINGTDDGMKKLKECIKNL
ncbi:TlpA family protein disulfide reductase [Chitinophagaceae bacterium LWZ2-11]